VYTGIVIKGIRVSAKPNGHVLVFDVGGSHVAAGVFGPGDVSVAAFHSVPVSSDGTVSEFLGTLASLAKVALHDHVSPIGVCVAIPNPFDYARGISYMEHKYRHLHGLDLRLMLSKVLLCDPGEIQFLNDATAFLMGEIQQGAATGADRVVGITLGTGLGSAFAIQGRIVISGPGVPPGGEIWDLPYKNTIVEDFVSSLAIQRLYKENTSTWAEVQDIANASAKSAAARRTFEQFGSRLGAVVRDTCGAFGPQRVILGGGIARAAALFQPSAQKELAALGIELRVSKLGERAALLGAGVNWIQIHNGVSQPREKTRAPDRA
jgi:glucokinase